jgi:hypothetical protein
MEIVRDPKEASLLLAKCSAQAPFETWKLLSDYAGKVADGGLDDARKAGVIGMARENGDLALAKVLELQSGKSRTELLQCGLLAFLDSNSAGAQTWFKEHGPSLSSEEKDVAQAAFAQFSLNNNNLTEAKQLVQQIGDPELRQKVGVQLWAAEGKAIDQESSKDPAGTLQSIVSGQSKHEDYWIEGAMWTWISKEPAKADEWYQKNWASLPAGKAQYVAAAYVSDSLKQGDTASARQWAAFIQEPNTKRRIEAAITQAEGQKGK